MSTKLSSQAETVLNVRVVVGKPQPDGSIKISTDKRFKNTATRLMTESICNYLAGAENTYKRGHGRPNYMGIGTMGITKQPTDANALAEVADNFEDKDYVEGETTRPWFESTSLALTTVCGPVNTDTDGNNLHFWDPSMAWGKDGFTGEPSDEPIFQGELCTNLKHYAVESEENKRVYDDIERIPILRADVLSDCLADWDYGVDGYSSQVIFYAYASVEWVHNLLKPVYKEIVKDPTTGEETAIVHEVGPQLDKMAVSEFGLYEKNNTDPHGLETMLAGFRVPSSDDLVYVTDGEVILIEWRVTVRAIMPNEGVRITGGPAPTGIKVWVSTMDDTHIQMNGYVLGDIGVNPRITWKLSGNEDPTTEIDESSGLITLGPNEGSTVMQVTATSKANPEIYTVSVVVASSGMNTVTGIAVSVFSASERSAELQAQVLGRGSYSDEVTWSMEGPHHPGTSIDPQTGVITIDDDETETSLKILATSVQDTEITSAAVVVQMNLLAGEYTVSDFSILTQ